MKWFKKKKKEFYIIPKCGYEYCIPTKPEELGMSEHGYTSGEPEQIPNWDKLETDSGRNIVRAWSKLTTVTIYDNGLYIMYLITDPGFKDAYLKNNIEE